MRGESCPNCERRELWALMIKLTICFEGVFLQKQTHDFQFLKISGFEGNIHQAERSQGVGLSWLSSAHQRGIAATSKQTKTQIQPLFQYWLPVSVESFYPGANLLDRSRHWFGKLMTQCYNLLQQSSDWFEKVYKDEERLFRNWFNTNDLKEASLPFSTTKK